MVEQVTVMHTPGPWHIALSMVGEVIQGAGGLVIAHIEESADYPANNARLIAAAPDLLAALELVEREFAHGSGPEWLDRVRAAIAKARGAS